MLLGGAGARFCAGGDVHSFVSADDRPAYLRDLAATLEVEIRRLSEPHPVVVAVHGSGGRRARLVLNADVVVAARSTRFTMAYAGSASPRLRCLIPPAASRRPAACAGLRHDRTGSQRDEALQWGLVTRVAADETVTREAFALSESLAGEAAGALAGAKRLIRSSWEATRAESAADEVETIASAVTSPEAQERLERFVTR